MSKRLMSEKVIAWSASNQLALYRNSFVGLLEACFLSALLLCSAILVDAQSPVGTSAVLSSNMPTAANKVDLAVAAPNRLQYILGPDDQLSLTVPDLEEEYANKVFRIDTAGEISLPLVGRLHAAGLTTYGLEEALRQRLSRGVLKNPEVNINIVTFGSQPVSVLGAVTNPGIRQLEGRKTLFETLSLAGGLRPDAGSRITISRDMKWGIIPLPGAKVDAGGRFSTASVRVKDILDAINTSENIIILPGDNVSVPRADRVYAVGAVTKPGGFLLDEHESLSALQVLSLAEGFQIDAAPQSSKILRVAAGSSPRIQIAVNLKQLMRGTGDDVRLQPGDILFVPNSAAKSAGHRAIDAAISIATRMAMYSY